jgi:hypothetical protein
MKFKSLVPALLAALATMAFTSVASATTLEVKGVKQAQAVTIKASLQSGSSTGWLEGSLGTLNTCTTSTIEGTTNVSTGTTVTAPIASLTFQNCTEGLPIVDAKGSVSIENISGTTNGTVRWTGTKVTVPTTPLGTLTCVTPSSGADVGTLTGAASGTASLDVTVLLNCGFANMIWAGTYVVTNPAGLGITF